MGFGDITRYVDPYQQQPLRGFGLTAYRQEPVSQGRPSSPTMNAASTNVNLERRLQAAGVNVPPPEKNQNLLTKALDILDRPGAAVRGAVSAAQKGGGVGEAWEAAKKGFHGQKKVSGQQLIQYAAKTGNPFAQRVMNSNKAGRFVGGLAVDIALDPLTFVTGGTTRAARTGDDLVRAVRQEVARETGRNITEASARRLAQNAEKGQVPVGRLGAAVNRALGYQAQTKTVQTGFGRLAKAQGFAKLAAQARQTTEKAEELQKKAAELKQGKLPIAGLLPPGQTKPDFVAGYKQVPQPRTYTIKPPEERLNRVINLIKPEVERQIEQANRIRQLISKYGAVPYESKKQIAEFLNKATGIPSGQLKRMDLGQLSELAASVASGAQARGMYAVASRVARMHGFDLEAELARGGMRGEDLIHQIAEENKWKRTVGLTETPSQLKVKTASKVNVPYTEAMPKEKALPVTNYWAKKTGRQMAKPLEEESKQLLKQAKELGKQARAVSRATIPDTTANLVEVAGKPGVDKTTLRFAGVPLVDVTPVRTTMGALVQKLPYGTEVTDALGRMFKFNYTPVAIKGVERAAVTAAKDRITGAVREIPYAREKGMKEVGRQWAGTSREAAEQAPYVIEETARGTVEAQRAAARAKELFAQDVEKFRTAGIPLNVIDNYVTHLYKDPPEKVKAVLDRWRRQAASQRVSGSRPYFTKSREIPTLEQAKMLGLTPIEDVRQLTMIHRALTEQAVVLQKMGRDLVAMGRNTVTSKPAYTADGKPFVLMSNSGIPALEGKYLHPEVAKAMANLYPLITNSDEGVKVAAQLIDKAVGAWKAVVLARPMFHIRNFVGNVFLNMADGVFNPYRYPQAVGVLTGALKHVELNGRLVPTQAIREMFAREALRGQGMFQEAAMGATGKVTEEAARMLQALQRGGLGNVAYHARHPFVASRKIGEASDSITRMANFLHHLDRGLSPAEAAQKTRVALFDYGALTQTEKNIRRWLVPFYTWTRFALPRMVERLVGSPGLFTGAAHVRENAVSINEVDETHLPEWLRDVQALPLWVDDKGQVHYLTLNLPLTELARIHELGDVRGNFQEAAMMTNPMFTTLAQIAMNRSILTDQEITKFEDVGGPEMWRDYGEFALGQLGMAREIANQLRGREEQKKFEQQLAEGEQPDVPPLERGWGEVLGMTSAQSPARWARADQYRRRDQLEQAKAAAEARGIKIPDSDELPDPGRATGFGQLASRGYGFGALAQQQILRDAGNAPVVVRQAMEIAGVPPDWEPYLAMLMQKESGGNPVAQNPLWVEYKTGRVSKTYPGPGWYRATGLFQMMQPTFDAHKVPGHDDIWNPLDNTLAAINYIKSRYGHPARIPRLGQEGYKGY